MDALYIINSKTKEVLIAKEFSNTESHLKLQVFLMDFNKIQKNEKSPFILINKTIFLYHQNIVHDIVYIALVSEDVRILP